MLKFDLPPYQKVRSVKTGVYGQKTQSVSQQAAEASSWRGGLPNFLSILNPAQVAAVRAGDAPLLIVAGAGTGKTKTLTARALQLIHRGAPAGSICAMTFTNKAAAEMRERIMSARPGGKPEPYVGTFHALGAMILRREARIFNRQANFAVFDNHDSFQLIKNILRGKEKKTAAGRTVKETLAPGLLSEVVSKIKNGVLSEHSLRQSADPVEQAGAKLLSRYETELEKNNAFDFDDLIAKVVVLFRHYPERLEYYRRRFRYVLVDEYQDLNNMQYELVRLLTGAAGERLSVVGDDQQTIYSWRGSNVEIFLNFEKDWPKARIVFLEENYRSTATIIRAAGSVIAHNTRQKHKNLWTKNPAGETVHILETLNEEVEAWEMVRVIQALGPATGTVGVLYRTNAQSRPLEQALLDAMIPYVIFGGLTFYQRKEVKDVLAAVRVAANPKDALSLERLEKNLTKTRLNSVREILFNPPVSPGQFIKLFLKQTGYLEYLDRAYPNAAERRENIAELLHFAGQFQGLSEFVERVSLVQSTDADTSGGRKGKPQNKPAAGTIYLMTAHMAKGLEFDTVCIAGCNEGLLPHEHSLDSAAELEEERRLMYVAMTRARQRLYISFYDVPSRFLSEIPAEYCDYISSAGNSRQALDSEERYITLD